MSENETRVERIVAMTERLTEALEADIAALDRGKPAEMVSIAPEMQQLTSNYGREVATLKATRLNALPAPARAALTAATKRFRCTGAGFPACVTPANTRRRRRCRAQAPHDAHLRAGYNIPARTRAR